MKELSISILRSVFPYQGNVVCCTEEYNTGKRFDEISFPAFRDRYFPGCAPGIRRSGIHGGLLHRDDIPDAHTRRQDNG